MLINESKDPKDQMGVNVSRLRWGAIIGGWVIGTACSIVLILFGMAIGGWTFDIRELHMTGIPIWIALWVGMSLTMAAFIGGFLASRFAVVGKRMDGLYHSMALWGLNWTIMGWLATLSIFFAMGSLLTAVKGAITTIGERVGAASQLDKNTSGQMGSIRDLRKQIESVLRATGKEELQPQRFKRDSDAVRDQARSGQSVDQLTDSVLSDLQQKLVAFDRDATINVLMTKLDMTRSQAERVVQSILPVAGPLKKTMLNVKEESLDLANAAVRQIGTAAWWIFVLSIVTFIATLTGGRLGVVRGRSITSFGKSIPDVRQTGS